METFQSEGVCVNVLESDWLLLEDFLESVDRLGALNFDLKDVASVIVIYKTVQFEDRMI
jgi:hypothetical protein